MRELSILVNKLASQNPTKIFANVGPRLDPIYIYIHTNTHTHTIYIYIYIYIHTHTMLYIYTDEFTELQFSEKHIKITGDDV